MAQYGCQLNKAFKHVVQSHCRQWVLSIIQVKKYAQMFAQLIYMLKSSQCAWVFCWTAAMATALETVSLASI